ncbi:3'(2'),5'-bisphosphate nucleotidase CysQ [Pelagovum pacificum]|uniref:3'(2'),5'-bisphosphate nucleotidase CysQ n=1 Tax=Pelagovum pacificum TaxID=2588711 RepID=A0A5C5GIU2_9RHOB|nr:3'(2'),5'-bisphosphate nucleotidase CysQ [Pelagovum pacificum]QQA43065.1 3'(2'),5'-bisphosphate nucleotidase CysQ [Pelagovum pacificum]TNY33791.1 3'(2'),5'-bisphosphate nucleotidase CysQ [Pelagovum pacificum]
MPETDPDSDLALLKQAARDAGDIALRYARDGAEVWHKPDEAGPVTEADLAVDGMLKDRLLTARPDHGWLSEETEDDTDRLSTTRQFIVDPIDGTRAFIAGQKDWAISIALAEAGEVIAGVVHVPVRGITYWARKGGGAFSNDTPISVAAPSDGTMRVLANRPAFDGRFWRDGTPPGERHFRSSIAYRLCLAATGRFDAMVTLRPSWEWDVAAGAIIVAEAGGIVTDRNDRPAIFNRAPPQIDGMIAAAPAAHAEIIARLDVPGPR